MPSRRAVLAATAGLAGLAGLAGCTEDDDPGNPTSTVTPVDPPTGSPDDAPNDSHTEESSRSLGPGVAWGWELDGAVSHAPAVDDRTVLATTTEGSAYAVDAGGEMQWAVGHEEPSAERPVLADGTALVTTGTTELGSTHTLRALDLEDGTEQWTFTTDPEWWLDVVGVVDDTVYVASQDDALEGETLYALDLATGEERWTAEVGDPRGGLATETGVYVPDSWSIAAFDSDGSRNWSIDGFEYQFRTLAAGDDRVQFVGEGSDGPTDTTLYTVDAASGEELWAFDDWFLSSLARHDGTLFAGGEHVAAFDPASGEQRWTAEESGAVYDAPVHDRLLFASGVTAVRTADGEAVWQYGTDEYIAIADAVVGDTVLVRSSPSRDDRNRHVHGVRAADGEARWEFEAEGELTRLVGGDSRAFAGSGDGRLLAFEER